MKPSILIDLERLRYPYSGLGYYCQCLEAGLRSLPSFPLELNYYKAGRGDRQSDERRFSHLHHYYNPQPSGYTLLHVTHQLQRYFLRTARVSGKRILTLHDLNFLYEQISLKSYGRRLKRVRTNLGKADVIVCISKFVADCLLEHRELVGLRPTQRIEVIHNGIMLGDGVGEQTDRLTPLIGRSYLLAIGAFLEKKQQHLLLEMLPYLPEDLHLVLVYSSGGEGYTRRLRQLTEELRLGGRVLYLESVSEAEKQYLLRHCTALIHPSIAEGFGIPPIEAMALGKPVFLSQATSLPEVGGIEAYYFTGNKPQAMATEFLEGLADYDRTPDKGERLIRWAQQYDYRAMASRYSDLYQSLL